MRGRLSLKGLCPSALKETTLGPVVESVVPKLVVESVIPEPAGDSNTRARWRNLLSRRLWLRSGPAPVDDTPAPAPVDDILDDISAPAPIVDIPAPAAVDENPHPLLKMWLKRTCGEIPDAPIILATEQTVPLVAEEVIPAVSVEEEIPIVEEAPGIEDTYPCCVASGRRNGHIHPSALEAHVPAGQMGPRLPP
ncbi:hypothetical protein BDZ89DRAFT_1130643 [Hymenopellis radicata]|nr:hypothetical protein BDZ89DRAFT_1130643 [Hymenopellis radicata]